MARLFAVRPLRKSSRRTSMTGDDEHDDNDDGLLSSVHRPHSNRVRDDNAVRLSIDDFPNVNEDEDEEEGVKEGEVHMMEEEEQDGSELEGENEALGDHDEAAVRGRDRELRDEARTEERRTEAGVPGMINALVDQHRAQVAQRVSTGKLKRVSTRTLGTPTAVPVLRSTAAQRRQGPELSARPDILDMEASPQSVKLRTVQPGAGVSRVERYRKNHVDIQQEHIDLQLQMESESAARLQVRTSPRKRQRESENSAPEMLRSRKTARIHGEHGRAKEESKSSGMSVAEQTNKENQIGGEPEGSVNQIQNTKDKRNKTSSKANAKTAAFDYPGKPKRGRPPKSLSQGVTKTKDMVVPLVGRARDSTRTSLLELHDRGAQKTRPSPPDPEAAGEQSSSRAQISRVTGTSLGENHGERVGGTKADEAPDNSDQRSGEPFLETNDHNLLEFADFSEQDGRTVSHSGAHGVEERSRAKRKAMIQSTKARQVDRQQETIDAPTEETIGPSQDAQQDAVDPDRMHGQWRALRSIFKARKAQARAVREHPVKLSDEVVKQIVSKCQNLIEQLSIMETSTDGIENSARHLIDVSEDVRALYTPTGSAAPEFDNTKRGINIYSHLFLKLFEVLQRMVACYEAIDRQKAERHESSYDNLHGMITLIDIILGLYGEQKGGAKQYRPRPIVSELPLIKPVESMCVALKPIRRAFEKILTRHLNLEARRTEATRQAQVYVAAREREEEDRNVNQAHRKDRDKWEQLHHERRCVEPPFLRDAKWKLIHLAFPEIGIEEDSDGIPMDRLEIFTPRIGPPLAMVQAVRNIVWAPEESNALLDGLKTYCGPMVIEKIIRRYCGKYNGKIEVLNKYNVTEIVTAAADMKQYYIWSQSRDDNGVEDWVTKIPEWVKPAPMPGKENEGREVENDVVARGGTNNIQIYVDSEAEAELDDGVSDIYD